MLPFKSVRYQGPRPGVRLIVLGAVHGNETCGTRAIERTMRELDSGLWRLCAGTLTVVPVANPMAYAHHRRAGDRNLNRKLAPTERPSEYEDHVANWLCPLLGEHEVLLDLHSFQSPGAPFVLVGPEDNDGPLQPFQHAAREEALAARLGVNRAVDGWLETYATGVERRRAHSAGATDAAEPGGTPGSAPDPDPRYGIGTTEYMRSVGGAALTLECGQHDDPAAPQVGYRAIRQTLAHLKLCDAPDPDPVTPLEGLRLAEVVDRLHEGDRFTREWRSFDPVRQGEVVATRQDGEPLAAPFDGYVVFPNAVAQPGNEWFYYARPNPRLTRG
jgi:succinylglutamate desuccinylase